MADGNDNDTIHRVDTVPPPNGDDDAYSAETRIGSMADAVMQETLVAANERALREAAEKAPASRPIAPRTSEAPPSSKSYVFDDTPEDEATKLGPLAVPHFPLRGEDPEPAKPAVISVLPAAPVMPAFAIPEEAPPAPPPPSLFRRLPFLTISVGIALILTVTIFLVTR